MNLQIILWDKILDENGYHIIIINQKSNNGP